MTLSKTGQLEPLSFWISTKMSWTLKSILPFVGFLLVYRMKCHIMWLGWYVALRV